MAEAPDFRALRSENQKNSQNYQFIYDTIYIHVFDDESGRQGCTLPLVNLFPGEIQATCHFPKHVAAFATDAVISGKVLEKDYAFALNLARLLRCENNPELPGDGIYSTHVNTEYLRIEELQTAITKFFSDEFEKIEKMKEELGNDTAQYIKYGAFPFVLDKDSEGLKEFLGQLATSSQRYGGAAAATDAGGGAGGSCNCNVCKPTWEMPRLEDVLLSRDKNGWTPLRWAAEVGSAECISVILDAAATAATPEAPNSLFTDVLHAVDDDDTPAVFVSVFRADVECIFTFLHAGADFKKSCGGGGISILEYLVHLASSDVLGSTYFPILEQVLKSFLETTGPKILTDLIYFEGEDSRLEKNVAEVEAMVEEEEYVEAEEELEQDGLENEAQAENGVEDPLVVEEQVIPPEQDHVRRPARYLYGRRPGPAYEEDDDEDDYYDDFGYDNAADDNFGVIYIPGFRDEARAAFSRAANTSDEKMVFGWSNRGQRDELRIPRQRRKSREKWEDVNWTLLSIAVRRVAVNVVKLFLDSGADPNYHIHQFGNRNSLETEPCALLCYAVQSSVSECYNSPSLIQATVTLLLDAGADVNAVEQGTKETALIKAARNRRAAVVVMLLQNGADPTLKNKKGKTAASIVEYRDPELAELLGREVRLARLMELIKLEDNSKAIALSVEQEENNINNNASGSNTNNVNGGENVVAAKDDDTVPDDKQCVVCWEREKKITLAPCGHQKCCSVCAMKVLSRPEEERRCPFCQTKIESYILQIYD